MQTRELLVPVKIVIEGEMTVKSIDEGVRRAWCEFPSRAWQAAVNHVERTAEKQNAGALRSKRRLWRVDERTGAGSTLAVAPVEGGHGRRVLPAEDGSGWLAGR